MSGGLNRCAFIGNLGADPELRFAQSGGAILRMRLAVNGSWKDKDGQKQERTEWITVVFFGPRAEGLEKHLRKGDRVYVDGRTQTREWEDKDGNRRSTTEIVGNELVFCGGKREAQREQHRTVHREQSHDGAGGEDFGDDSIPFASVDERLH